MATDKAVDITCKICGAIQDGYVISATSETDKILICKNCIAKLKEVA